MKRNIAILSVLLIGMFLNSCDQKERVDNSENSNGNIENSSEDLSFYERYPNAKKMKEIDARINPSQRVESLAWEKQTENGSEFVQVSAYLNEDGLPMKFTEFYIDGNFQPQGQRHYYLENNSLIGFHEQTDSWIDSLTTNFTEKRTIFKDGKPVISQIRTARTYDKIDDIKWKETQTEEHSLKKVNNILTGAEEFQTHFISVIKTDQLFLLLGEPKPNTEERYTTAVRVDTMTPFIEDLLKNLDKYKFRPVNITFEVVGGNNTPEYRVLTNIAWKD